MLVPKGKYSEIVINCLNWKDSFPSHPYAKVSLSHSSDALHLCYYVKEENIKADCKKDREPVWEDSCVEMFLALQDKKEYFNIEANSRGCLYMCKGVDRNHRTFLPQKSYDVVKRLPEVVGVGEWRLFLDIPSEVFGFQTFDRIKARANFYKCLGGEHYLSWAPVSTPKPDFHRPEFFEELNFE